MTRASAAETQAFRIGSDGRFNREHIDVLADYERI
jgi:hypothetical protein